MSNIKIVLPLIKPRITFKHEDSSPTGRLFLNTTNGYLPSSLLPRTLASINADDTNILAELSL